MKAGVSMVNPFGLVFMTAMLIPNAIFAIRCREGFSGPYHCRTVELLEQAGRFGCMALMILKGPGFGFSSDEALALYLIVDTALVAAYDILWVICFRRNGVFRALSLSILPSVIFLFSGVISHSPLLIVAALVFAPCHILISYRSAVPAKDSRS